METILNENCVAVKKILVVDLSDYGQKPIVYANIEPARTTK